MNLEHLAKIKGVLFDLDGTLLQVEMSDFIPAYINGLEHHFSDLTKGLPFDRVVRSAIRSLLTREEEGHSNEQLFLLCLERHLGLDRRLCGERLERYCANGMAGLQTLIRPLPLARTILQRCFERGLKVAVATNPVFPRAMIDARLRWGGIGDFPFDLVTSFENTRYCKPHPGYFLDLLGRLGLAPEECIMVGNDTEHDLGARSAGIPTFLVDTWLIDRLSGNYATDFHGDHFELFRFLEHLGEEGGRQKG